MSNKSSRADQVAAARREQEAAQRRRTIIIVSAIVAAIAVLVAILFVVLSKSDTTGEHSDTPRHATSSYGALVGEASAPHTIVLYEDFQCPICNAFEAQSAAQVRAAVDAGKVNVEYRMVSFLDRSSENKYSSRAANAAYVVLDAAGPEVFWKFHDLLYENQPEEGTAGPGNDELVDLAVQAGAERSAVEQGIDDGEFDQYVVNATDAMSKNDVTGTPTAFIDGELAGSNPAEALSAVLDLVS